MTVEKKQLMGALEASLFVSGEPIECVRLEKILDITATELTVLIEALREKLERDGAAGLQVLVHDGRVALATKGEYASILEQLTRAAREENLSRAALEVLAIIAYRAPITRAEIEAIRGVNCSFTVRNLLLRALIERVSGTQEHQGFLYQPTFQFLQSLGLTSVADLPDFATLREDDRLLQLLEKEAPAAPGETSGSLAI